MRKSSQWTLKKLVVLPIVSVILFASPGKAQQGELPNILIILADDLGYGDLKSYNPNSLIPTPNLDELASGGTRLTDAYCPVSVCSPSRYALMTGTYPWRSRKKSGVMANYEPSMIDSGQLTLPKMLRQGGYVTAGFGKWHLGTTFPTLDGEKPIGYGKFKAENNGANLDFSQPVSDGPLDHGFDHWLGFSCASECWILEGNKVVGALKHNLYTTDAAPGADQLKQVPLEDYLPFITEKSLGFLRDHVASDQGRPFFLYYAPYVPHIPLAVSPAFQGTTEAGQYGDYVSELDHYVGQLLGTLDSLGLTDNTLVLFASDNGSQFVVTSRELNLSEASNSPGENSMSAQNTGEHHPNHPLRGTKWTAWEGGVRTPLIARWPGHVPAATVSRQLFALNDVMATLATVIDYDLPATAAIDSYDLLPALMGKKKPIRQEVVIQSSGNVLGLRQGNWKYIRGKKDDPPQLYDLSVDESESADVYAEYPTVVKKLEQRLKSILTSERSAN